MNYGKAEEKNTGDFTRIVALNDHKLAILFGDGEGHGNAATQDSIDLHELINLQRRIIFRNHDPSAILAELDAKSSAFVGRVRTESSGTFALLVAVIDTNTWKVDVASAAMPPPYVIDETNDAEPVRSFAINLGLGIYKETKDDPISFTLEPGQKIAFMSDGITESGQRNDFPIEPLLENVVRTNHGLDNIAKALFNALPPAHDDQSLLLIERAATP